MKTNIYILKIIDMKFYICKKIYIILCIYTKYFPYKVNSDFGKLKFEVKYVELPAGQDWFYPDVWISLYTEYVPVFAIIHDCSDTTLMVTQTKFSEYGQLFVRFNKAPTGKIGMALAVFFRHP